jgi:hypothetical protein
MLWKWLLILWIAVTLTLAVLNFGLAYGTDEYGTETRVRKKNLLDPDPVTETWIKNGPYKTKIME